MDKLLVFTENYPKGGGNRYLIDLINSLAEDKYDIVLFSNPGAIYPEDTRRLTKKITINSIFFITQEVLFSKNIFLSYYKKYFPKLLSALLILIEPFFIIYNTFRFFLLFFKLKPDCVIACNGGYPASKACLAMMIAANLSKIPTVLSIVSMPAKRSRYFLLYEMALDLIVWRSCDRVIVNARAISKALLAERGMPINKSHVIYNGLNSLLPTDNAMDIGFAVHKSDFILGLVARLDREKGVLFLFDAFVSLVQKHPNMKLVLVGSGNASDELVSRTNELGLQDRVKLLGYFDGDISGLLSRFDIYVFPSLWEGLPYSILEALRSGCVVVATDVGGISEAITDGVDGLLIKPGCSLAIAGAIDRLINDPALCVSLSLNAKSKFQSKFTLKNMNKRVQDVFAGMNDVSCLKGL